MFYGKMATIVGVNGTTMRRIFKKDLRYHFYMMRVKQMLSEVARMNRMAPRHLLISSLKNEATGRIRYFFSEAEMIDSLLAILKKFLL